MGGVWEFLAPSQEAAKIFAAVVVGASSTPTGRANPRDAQTLRPLAARPRNTVGECLGV